MSELPGLYIDKVKEVYINELTIDIDIIEKINECLRAVGEFIGSLLNNWMEVFENG